MLELVPTGQEASQLFVAREKQREEREEKLCERKGVHMGTRASPMMNLPHDEPSDESILHPGVVSYRHQ